MDAGTGKSYYLLNAHGDVVQLTDAAGAVTQTYDYDAFGNQKSENPVDANPFRYCGEYFDVETGTIYLRARYYDPSVGRFNRQDPARDGLNWYTYCNNNPSHFVDPTGLSFVSDAQEFFNNFVYSSNQRLKNVKDPISFLDWMTYGYLSANQYRYEVMHQGTNWYSVGNYASGGSFDVIKGTVKPEEPLSFDHWMNSFGTATLAYSILNGMSGPVNKIGGGYLQDGAYFDELRFSKTALEHMDEAGRTVPIQTLQDAIRYGEAFADPRGSSAIMYYTTMMKNRKLYNLEVLYDNATNTVYHFEYARKAMGNLPAIPK